MLTHSLTDTGIYQNKTVSNGTCETILWGLLKLACLSSSTFSVWNKGCAGVLMVCFYKNWI